MSVCVIHKRCQIWKFILGRNECMNDECACHAPRSERSRNLDISDIKLLVKIITDTPDWKRRAAELSEEKEAAHAQAPSRAYDDREYESDTSE